MAYGISKPDEFKDIRMPFAIAVTSTADGLTRITVGPIEDPENTRWIVLTPEWAFQVALWILEARDGERPE